MRIFYLITKSTTGGAQTHIYQMSKYFIGEKNEVAVMSQPGGALEQKIKKLGALFFPNQFFSNNLNFFKIFKAIKEIKKVIEDFKPDIISCHSTAAGFLGRIATKNRVPTIFTAHGWSFNPNVPWGKRGLAFLAEKIVSSYCSKVICVSEFDKELAIKYRVYPKERLKVIHNGVEVQEKRENIFSSLESEKIKIIFVGRLNKQKDPMLLIKAFNSLDLKIKNKTEISIIGDGPKKWELEKFIRKNNLEKKIKLLGDLPQKEVFKILRESHLFVLTSNWEGFPRSILEAMSFGLAVVASDVGGVRESVSEENGILIKKGDEESFKNALERLLKNPSLVEKMGREGWRKARDEFFLEKMFKETESLYESILENKN